MATLLSAVSSNGAGTGASMSGPCTVFVRGTFAGATVVIQVADEDVDGSYVKADNVAPLKASRLDGPGPCGIDCKGTYYVRAVVSGATGSTSITAVTTQ